MLSTLKVSFLALLISTPTPSLMALLTTCLQNLNYRNWTALIELNRDSWIETTKINSSQALLIARQWLQIPYPLFKRLAFFAATHSEIVPSKEGLKWLLKDKTHWFWSNQTKRESIRLLVSLTSKLDAQDQIELENTIIKGPPAELLDSLNESLTSIECDYLVWERLAKYGPIHRHR